MKNITHNGKSYVLLEAKAWDALVKGRASMPKVPAPDSDGNVSAVEFARATIARRIIRDRTALGLSQVRLARLAGIRPETLNRIEKGKVTLDVATAVKIEKALKQIQSAQLFPSMTGVIDRALSNRRPTPRRRVIKSA
ncbi:MAG TPA: helix-turn-helix transcriptional regulator [Tepidisphaeraceae bacterium]|jgi:DNA-binding XRE family transcriptional regulator